MSDLYSLVDALLFGIASMSVLAFIVRLRTPGEEGVRIHKVTTAPIPECMRPKSTAGKGG